MRGIAKTASSLRNKMYVFCIGFKMQNTDFAHREYNFLALQAPDSSRYISASLYTTLCHKKGVSEHQLMHAFITEHWPALNFGDRKRPFQAQSMGPRCIDRHVVAT